LRPARGCSCDGSGNDVPDRKDDTSAAVEGSKGVGEKESVTVSDDEGEEDEEDVEFEDLRPVRASQNDDIEYETEIGRSLPDSATLITVESTLVVRL
jgi:hypothetical protein